jgi:microcystin-dependent protein
MIKDIFKAFIVSLSLIANIHFSYAQTAALLPNATQTFLDNNGNPLSSGTVQFDIPNTTTAKTVWQDANQTTPWPSTITLSAAGRPPGDKGIYGNGAYRQIVKDVNGNIIWDQPTFIAGGSAAGTTVGDGNSVGTILTWAGSVAPAQYQFASGQTVSRTSFAALFQAITIQQSAACIGGSATITGLIDTSNVPIGASVESICLPLNSTVVSKTSSSITLNNNAIITTSTAITIFPYGDGDGSTSFNLPDLRGRVIPGRNNMEGVTSSNLTSQFYGSDPNSIGAIGGNQSRTLLTTNLPPYTPIGSITNGAISVSLNTGGLQVVLFPGSSGAAGAGSGNTIPVNLTASASQGTSTFTGAAQGGSSTAFSIVQPSITLNYIIKVTPDVSVSGLFGVASLGGMQGVITCGTGIICAGNNISATVGAAAGSNAQVQFNNSGSLNADPCFIWVNPTLTIGLNGTCAGQLKLAGATSGVLTQTVGSVAGTPIITWGTNSGTPVVTVSTPPLVLNTSTGNLSITSSALTKTNDTNVTLTLGGSPSTSLLAATSLTLGWSGTLAAGRLNDNVVQAVTNDTNITGSISAQNLTLGWSGTLSLTRGGSANSTAISARSSTGFNIDEATSTGDANYTILSTDRMVYHTALTAARTDTLPLANSVNAGQQFVINDFRGVASASNTITLQRSSSDTINGVNSLVAINSQFGAGIYWSDGVSRWTFFPQTTGGGGGGTVSQVVCGTGLDGGTITTTGTCSLSAARRTLPTTTVLTTGTNATYTTPANVLWLEIRSVGAGGGGGSNTAGTAGGSSCFSTSSPACTSPLFTANGGSAGGLSIGGAGGSSSGGYSNTFGNPGASGVPSTGSTSGAGGGGGPSCLGGAGMGGTSVTAATAGAANSGSGGGGGGNNTAAIANAGGGGGAGGCLLGIINSPAASYFYTIGAGGAGAAAGGPTNAGAIGANGKTEIIEHYGT